MVDQIELFGAATDLQDPIGTAAASDECQAWARQLPAHVRLGTSSWTFPGWAGLVYRQRVSEQRLAAHGLGSYAQHPLLRSVGVDRTFYRPVPESEFSKWARAVPEDFRFLVKAHAALTTPPDLVPAIPAAAMSVTRYLDADYAIEHVIAPAMAGLRERLGLILFQFPPLSLRYTQDAARFADTLAGFLGRLPKGPAYGVELRNRDLLTVRYAHVLAEQGATHCFNVHPKMPDVLEQARLLGEPAFGTGTVAVRWMLHPKQSYDAARARYFPFDRLVDPDLPSRLSIVELIHQIAARGQEVMLIANNKAEGSAPLSLMGVAAEMARHQQEQDARL